MSYNRYFVTRKVVSKQFRGRVARALPGLGARAGYWRLLEYLMFGAFFSPDTKRLIIPQGLLAHLAGPEAEERYKHGHFVAQTFLDAFKRDVLPGLSYTGHHGGEGYAREVRHDGIPDRLLSLAQREVRLLAAGAIPTREKVYFSSGARYNDLNARSERRAIERLAADTLGRAPMEPARTALAYLNGTPSAVFTKLQGNIAAARLASQSLVKYKNGRRDEPATARTRMWNERILNVIQHQAVPFYQPSGRGNTVRLFPLNESLLLLSKEVRRALTPGWHEYDLRSSQLAIVATLWDIPLAKEFLRENLNGGPSIWESLFDHYKIQADDEVKQVFKGALYSLIFGMHRPTIQGNITKGLKAHGHSASGARFFDHPVILAVAKARDRRIQEVENAGGLTTIYGKKLHMKNEERSYRISMGGKRRTRKRIEPNTSSLLAQEAQALEFMLISPVFDLARRYERDFRIVLFQHDGFSVSYSDATKTSRYEEKLKLVVRERAQEYGVLTELVKA